ncbi:hypothetical protein Snoj_22740 [Streptomyces nojiriensis]|uniref:Uncharacterized protein n=1 Tax=Streptomyces nojiriensis TaxID=66374 RepID=A0ABQ3SJQ3_9ACTN|nr:hypothetical protein [Streptomyces nojiriensis]QTI49961.1 hypothetical protein JYK04_07835 [Streptomyces nojiriensis]GGS21784.1 hypothetical protein GCM10010205_59510 [Streptomyces nojiriensis]GHI68356.1 hypothetical protein Snoj_22740 [Streptomyces nojiriensis]
MAALYEEIATAQGWKLTLAMQRTKTATARRRVLSLIGYAIVAALGFDVIISPILGVHPEARTSGRCGAGSP